MSFTNSDIEQVKRPKIARNKYNYVNGAITSVGNYYSSRGSSNSGGSGGVYYSNFIGCSDVSDGGNGLVPAPGAGQHRHYLCGNGNWVYSGSYYDSSTLYVDADNTVFLNNVSLGDKATANNFVATNLTSTTANINTAVINNASINTEIVKTSSIENLTVTGSAHFFNLMIDEVKACGGQLLLSAADFVVDEIGRTSMATAPTIVKEKFADATDIHKIRLYQKNTDTDGNEILNKWSVGDLAYCQTFNLSNGGVYSESANKYYWVLVVAVGTYTISGVNYNYIECCDKYYKNNNTNVAYPVGKGSFNPDVGDNIALLGNITDTDRQNAIIISAYKSPDAYVTAPSIVQYKGINDFTLDGKIYNKMAANGNTFRGDFKVSSGIDISTYIENLITESVDSAIWKMVPTELSATVSKSDVLTFTAKYGVYKQDGSVMSLQTTSTTDDNKSIVVRYKSDVDNSYTTISRIRNYYECSKTINNYHKQTSKPTKYIVELVIDNTIIQTDTIPVVFNAGAILEITDSISATVQDVSGNLSQVVQSSSTWVSTISDVSNRVSAIEQTAGNLSLYVKESDLKTTGIDISTGTITLNADKTTVNGLLSVKGNNNGFAVYDSSANLRVMIDDKKVPDSYELTNSSIFYIQKNASFTTIEKRYTPFDYVYTGTLHKGDATDYSYGITIDFGSLECTNSSTGDYLSPTLFDVYCDVSVYEDGYASEAIKTSTKLTKTRNPVSYYTIDTQQLVNIPSYSKTLHNTSNAIKVSLSFRIESLHTSVKTITIYGTLMFSSPTHIMTHIGNRNINCLHGQMNGFYSSPTETIIQNGYNSNGIKVDSTGVHNIIGTKLIYTTKDNATEYKYSAVYGSGNMLNFSDSIDFKTGQTVYKYNSQYGSRETLASNVPVWDWSTDTNTFNIDICRLDKSFIDAAYGTGNVYILLPDTITNSVNETTVAKRVNFSPGRKITFMTNRDNIYVCTYDNNFGIERVFGSDHGWASYIKLSTYDFYDFILTKYGWMVSRHD